MEKYAIATAACLGLLILYAVIGAALGWAHGGGAVIAIAFFALEVYVWRALTTEKKPPAE